MGEHIQLKNLQRINLASIAKVCDTDVVTIEMILKEIVTQLKEFIKKGQNVRLMFKFGILIVKNGELNWKPISDANDDLISQAN